MLPRWAVRISLTGSYLPHLHTCLALASPSLSPLFLALSVRCPSLALNAVTQPVGWWRGAVNPQQRPSLPHVLLSADSHRLSSLTWHSPGLKPLS